MIDFPERLTISWIKNQYQNRTLTPRQLAEEIIRRSEKYREYHIWITPPDCKRIQKYIDVLPEDRENCALWGIPFAVKDNIDVAGMPTTAACEAFRYEPSENAEVVERLIKAGGIPIGKTNLDQFATGLVGTRSPYGETCNALDPKMISGGSSSGSAAAVALGMAAFSLGTDTAGSGRVPAALNGLIGYKPPLGAWSTKGVVPACASLDCVTVFTNDLKDVRTVNLSARGTDGECCWSREFLDPAEEIPSKIYLPEAAPHFFGTYAKLYEHKWEQSVKRLGMSGIKIEYIDISLFSEAASILYDGPWIAERWADLGGFVKENPGKLFPVTEKILRSGDHPDYTASSVFTAMHQLKEYTLQANHILKDAVLIMPTAGGTFTREEVRKNPIETNNQMGLYTNHCNLLDLCGAAIPHNTRDRELPFGITIFSKADQEGLVLKTAEKFLETE